MGIAKVLLIAKIAGYLDFDVTEFRHLHHDEAARVMPAFGLGVPNAYSQTQRDPVIPSARV
jgi:hypothetical protein